jgi:hypothetical protein
LAGHFVGRSRFLRPHAEETVTIGEYLFDSEETMAAEWAKWEADTGNAEFRKKYNALMESETSISGVIYDVF